MAKIDDLLAVVTVCAPATHGALSVYPLKRAIEQRFAAYLVLDEALASGRFRITEVSEIGTVPLLLAINETDRPVFLLDGEELVGAKQNRVLNLSLLLEPKSKTEIPVSCVEAGRWRADSNGFRAADRVQFARGRAQKMEQVSRSLCLHGEAASNQTAVWDVISAKSARMGVASATGAMAALFESRQAELQEYLGAFPVFHGQVGAVFAIGGDLAGIEVFDSEATFKKLACKLVASYALDAMELSTAVDPPDISAAVALIKSVGAAPLRPITTVGIGKTVRFSTEKLVGAVLEVDGFCVHLAALARTPADERFPLKGAAEVRIQRSSMRAARRTANAGGDPA